MKELGLRRNKIVTSMETQQGSVYSVYNTVSQWSTLNFHTGEPT